MTVFGDNRLVHIDFISVLEHMWRVLIMLKTTHRRKLSLNNFAWYSASALAAVALVALVDYADILVASCKRGLYIEKLNISIAYMRSVNMICVPKKSVRDKLLHVNQLQQISSIRILQWVTLDSGVFFSQITRPSRLRIEIFQNWKLLLATGTFLEMSARNVV